MSSRRRAVAGQHAQRINRALVLLSRSPVPTVLQMLVRYYRVSPRQARRYVAVAQQQPQGVPVPEPAVAFTVKLPIGLIRQVRAHARATRTRLSSLVTRALEEWLERGRPGPHGGR